MANVGALELSSSRPEILAAIQAAFVEVLPEQAVTLKPEDDLAELGLASVAVLEMAASLETRYDIIVGEEQLAELRTVDDFVSLVERLLAERADGS